MSNPLRKIKLKQGIMMKDESGEIIGESDDLDQSMSR